MAAEFETSYAGIWNLDPNIPGASGQKKYGDDNIRGTKYAIVYTFPNIRAPVTASDSQLNGVNGTYSNPTFTGTPIAPTPVAGTNTTQVATMAALQTACAAVVAGTFVDQLMSKAKLMFYAG
jgi:hypothetical protein